MKQVKFKFLVLCKLGSITTSTSTTSTNATFLCICWLCYFTEWRRRIRPDSGSADADLSGLFSLVPGSPAALHQQLDSGLRFDLMWSRISVMLVFFLFVFMSYFKWMSFNSLRSLRLCEENES